MNQPLCTWLPRANPPSALHPGATEPFWEYRCADTGRIATCPASNPGVMEVVHLSFEADGFPYTAQMLSPRPAGIEFEPFEPEDQPDDELVPCDWDDEPSLSAAERNPSLCR